MLRCHFHYFLGTVLSLWVPISARGKKLNLVHLNNSVTFRFKCDQFGMQAGQISLYLPPPHFPKVGGVSSFPVALTFVNLILTGGHLDLVGLHPDALIAGGLSPTHDCQILLLPPVHPNCVTSGPPTPPCCTGLLSQCPLGMYGIYESVPGSATEHLLSRGAWPVQGPWWPSNCTPAL